MRFQLLFFIVLIASTLGAPSKKVPKTGRGDKFSVLSFLIDVLFHVVGEKDQNGGQVVQPPDGSLTLMQWNLLAPMWVDRKAMKAGGEVDLNLVNDAIRLKVALQHIKEISPDILNLQEVQEDTFSTITESLADIYEPVAFAPNVKDYWKSFLQEGMEYKKNGVATFIKKGKVIAVKHNAFETSDQGSVALSSVLQQPNGKGRPIVVVNCHLESGVTVEQSTLRFMQGAAVMAEAARLTAEIKATSPESQPVVFIGGDINTFNPFPGYTNFINNGYVNTIELAGDPSPPTFFYDTEIPVPGLGTITSAPLDHIFTRESDLSSGLKIEAAAIPDIRSDMLTEDSYIDRLTMLLAQELRSSSFKGFWRIMESDVFKTIVKIATDNVNNDHNVNRVLRMGSDHMPVFVRFKFEEEIM